MTTRFKANLSCKRFHFVCFLFFFKPQSMWWFLFAFVLTDILVCPQPLGIYPSGNQGEPETWNHVSLRNLHLLSQRKEPASHSKPNDKHNIYKFHFVLLRFKKKKMYSLFHMLVSFFFFFFFVLFCFFVCCSYFCPRSSLQVQCEEKWQSGSRVSTSWLDTGHHKEADESCSLCFVFFFRVCVCVW